MVNKKFTQNQRKELLLLAAIVIAITTFVVGSLLLQKPVTMGNSQPVVPTEGSIDIKGTILCLPHTNTSGPQTDECAYGLRDENGQYYAIRDTDPSYRNISVVPMNEKVTVTGSFQRGTNAVYPTISTIKVTKITR